MKYLGYGFLALIAIGALVLIIGTYSARQEAAQDPQLTVRITECRKYQGDDSDPKRLITLEGFVTNNSAKPAHHIMFTFRYQNVDGIVFDTKTVSAVDLAKANRFTPSIDLPAYATTSVGYFLEGGNSTGAQFCSGTATGD